MASDPIMPSALQRAIARLRRFRSADGGNIAVIFALTFLVLVVVAGMAIDLNRYNTVRSKVQESVDTAALAAAASKAQSQAELDAMATLYLRANLDVSGLSSGWKATAQAVDKKTVRVSLNGGVTPFFAGLIGIERLNLNVSADATRGVAQKIEVVLVLDNTWSMSEIDSRNVSRISALKKSATALVTEVMADPDAPVAIAIAPYAEYVNVGKGVVKSNQAPSWLYIPPEPAPQMCDQKIVYSNPYQDRCSTRDGVVTSQMCTYYAKSIKVKVEPYKCNQKYWHGCVYSRNQGDLRLSDTDPSVRYTAIYSGGPTCLNEIKALSTKKKDILDTINKLVINVGNYKPETHIPSGMIWGLNLLSPTAPFTEGEAYDENNRAPRKIIVLMTDGVNKMRYKAATGEHVAATSAAQLADADRDLIKICDYAKSKKIEIYTVGLNVPTAEGKKLLSQCSSGTDKSFVAEDSVGLERAFRNIALSIGRVRLVQ